MSRVNYSRAELEAEHEYAAPHVECGLALHGGFDARGHYLSPRTKHRWDAVNAWMQQLRDREVPIVEATAALLTEPNYPTVEQQLLLLENHIHQPLWDSLTTTGLIEARGKALADVVAPDFQEVIQEDIAGTALAHMNEGLLTAHGWDEGGNPATNKGGHDVMWFAVRDLIFGADAFPVQQPPASIARPRDDREMPALPPAHEGLLSFLMNLLMIEVRAERTFDFYERVIGNERVLRDKRPQAERAVTLIDRIRQDESIHVAWLRTAISEFRSFTVKTPDGGATSGADIVDPVWERMVHWHAVETHRANREHNRQALRAKILATPNGESIIDEFERLAA